MENKLDDLFLKFRAKGFFPIEIQDLVKDALNIAGNSDHPAISAIDQELEDLGWGIGVMDNVTYELIITLSKKIPFCPVKHTYSF